MTQTSILQISFTKSGSYWLWKIIQEALRARGLPLRSVVAEHPIQHAAAHWRRSFPELHLVDMLKVDPESDWMVVLPRYQEKINDIDAYVAQVSHCWTHSPVWGVRAAQTFARFDKRVCLVRDLRAILVSRAHYDLTPYKVLEFDAPPADFEASLRRALEVQPARWVHHVRSWQELSERQSVYFVRYEDLKADFTGTCEGLLGYLWPEGHGVDLDDLARRCSTSAMSAGAPQHVRGIDKKRWTEVLTPEHLSRLPEEARALIERLPRGL